MDISTIASSDNGAKAAIISPPSSSDHAANTILSDKTSSINVLPSRSTKTKGKRTRHLPVFWTDDKVQLLQSQIKKHGWDWDTIKRNVPAFSNKTSKALKGAARTYLYELLNDTKPKLPSRSWSSEEILRLENLLRIHGNNYDVMVPHFQNRAATAIRWAAKHKVKNEKPVVVKKSLTTDWTLSERQVLRDQMIQEGHYWAGVAKALPGRGAMACEAYASRHCTREFLAATKGKYNGSTYPDSFCNESTTTPTTLKRRRSSATVLPPPPVAGQKKKVCKKEQGSTSTSVGRKRQREVLSLGSRGKKIKKQSTSSTIAEPRLSVGMNNTLECVVCNSVSHQFAPRRYCSACNFVIHTYCAFTAYSGVNDLSEIKFDCCDNCKKMVRYYANNHHFQEEIPVDGKTAMNERRLFLRAMLNAELEEEVVVKDLFSAAMDEKTKKVISKNRFKKIWKLMDEREREKAASIGFTSAFKKSKCPSCCCNVNKHEEKCEFVKFAARNGLAKEPGYAVFWYEKQKEDENSEISSDKTLLEQVLKLFNSVNGEVVGDDILRFDKAFNDPNAVKSSKLWNLMSEEEKDLAALKGFSKAFIDKKFHCPVCKGSKHSVNSTCAFKEFIYAIGGKKYPKSFVFLWKKLILGQRLSSSTDINSTSRTNPDDIKSSIRALVDNRISDKLNNASDKKGIASTDMITEASSIHTTEALNSSTESSKISDDGKNSILKVFFAKPDTDNIETLEYKKAYGHNNKARMRRTVFSKIWSWMDPSERTRAAKDGFTAFVKSSSTARRFICPECKLTCKHKTECRFFAMKKALGTPSCFFSFLWTRLQIASSSPVKPTTTNDAAAAVKSTTTNDEESKKGRRRRRRSSLKDLLTAGVRTIRDETWYTAAYDERTAKLVPPNAFNVLWSWMSSNEHCASACNGFLDFVTKQVEDYCCPECKKVNCHKTDDECKFKCFQAEIAPRLPSMSLAFLWSRVLDLDLVWCNTTTSSEFVNNLVEVFTKKKEDGNDDTDFKNVMMANKKVMSWFGVTGARHVWNWMTEEERKVAKKDGFEALKPRGKFKCPECALGHQFKRSHDKSCLFRAFLEKVPRVKPGCGGLIFLWSRIKTEAKERSSNVIVSSTTGEVIKSSSHLFVNAAISLAIQNVLAKVEES